MTTTTVYLVAGMSCGHCVRAVTTELSALAGVQDVSVALADDGPARVSIASTEPLDEQAVRAAVDEAGYDLVGTGS